MMHKSKCKHCVKTIDELGISPAPWKFPHSCLTEGFVWGGDRLCVCHISGKPSETYKAMNEIARKADPSIGYVPPSAWHDYANPSKAKANARLIAAAPEMYECLREAICQTCLLCQYKKCNECKVVNKWKAAILKAGGEEEA